MPRPSTVARVRKLFLVCVIAYALLGVIFVAIALAQPNETGLAPYPGLTTNVPTGSDDASVKAFYRYLDARQLAMFTETYGNDYFALTVLYLFVGAMLIVVGFFTVAWYARRSAGDLYPVEIYDGNIAERGGPVDPFNWATYSVILIYMIYYAVMNLLFGQPY